MREAILASIRSRSMTTFQDLTADVAGFHGHLGMFTPERDSIIIWHACSQEAITALGSLIADRSIRMQPAPMFLIVLRVTCLLLTSVAPSMTSFLILQSAAGFPLSLVSLSLISSVVHTKGLTRRCSEPRPALMRSFRVVSSSSLRPCALSGAVADLVSR